MKKSIEQIRDEMAEKHCSFIKGPCHFELSIFKKGFDARHKLGDEELDRYKELLRKQCNRSQDLTKALRIAVEALNHIKEVEEFVTSGTSSVLLDDVNEALSKIQELMGDEK